MPNWVYGSYAIKGKKENIINFLNEGLKNSRQEPRTTCKEAFDALVETALTKTSTFDYCGTYKGVVEYEHGLTMGTFRPMPDTFLEYDTTNEADLFPEVAEQQKKEYGAVGWYDYSTDILWGVKWDADLDDFSLVEDGDTAIIFLDMQTAWGIPSKWLEWLKSTFNVNVFLCCHEESNAFNLYGEIDSLEDCCDGDDCPKEEDFDDEDAFWDAVYDYRMQKIDEMRGMFENIVNTYDVA